MYVVKVSDPYFHLFAPARDSTMYGVVDDFGFETYRKSSSNTIPMTIARGKLVAGSSGQPGQLVLSYQLNFFPLLFFVLWNAFFLSALTLILLLPGDSHWEACIPLAFLLLGHWYIMIRFQDDIQFFKLFFEENIFGPFLDKPTEAFDSEHDSSGDENISPAPQSERTLDPYV